MSKVVNLDDSRKKKEADRQKAMRLMEALSGVDAELLERSEGTVAAFPFWRYGKQLAVCFACMVLGVCAIGVYSVTTSNYGSSQSNSMKFDSEAIMTENGNSSPEWDGAGGMAGGAAQSPAEDYEEALPENQAGLSDKSEQTEQPSNEPKNNQTDTLGGKTIGSDTPQEMDKEVSCPVDSREKITLETAKQMERIGGYVPETIPAGYVFESARGSAPANSYLDMSLCWCKGMDDIMLHITEFYAVASMPADVYDSFSKRIVNPAKPETYDEHLYEIPYAETVPREYREVFDNPVFRESDFSLELVKARMKSVADAGDTNTPRGRFAVLYDSGILVEFNGRGSAEEIWEMFQSIQP